MLKNILVINSGSDSLHFMKAFSELSLTANVNSASLCSKDCALIVCGNKDVLLVHNDETIPLEQTGFFIKSYKGDAYLTYLIARVLEEKSTLFSDPANLLSSNSADKMTMMVSLSLHGLPVPPSILCTARSYAANKNTISKQISYPCVIKKTGSRGKQVWKVDDEAALLEKLNADTKLTLIQEYIPNDHDFRIFVFDDTVLTSIRRDTADGFYNNVSQGGRASHAEITEEEAALCIEATKIAKLRISGVDFVRNEGRPYIFEVNKNPQLSLFNEAAGFDLEAEVSRRVLADLLKK